jgi:hypothetical protein
MLPSTNINTNTRISLAGNGYSCIRVAQGRMVTRLAARIAARKAAIRGWFSISS